LLGSIWITYLLYRPGITIHIKKVNWHRKIGPPFYGWWLVLAAIVGQFVAIGSNQTAAGILLTPITTDFGWSKSQYTLGGTLAFALSALVGLYIGPKIDRYGPRIIMMLGTHLLVVALFLSSFVNKLWQYTLMQILSGGLSYSLLGPLVVNTTLSKWFVQKRGLAIAFGSWGVSLAAILTPHLLSPIIETYGWRISYRLMAIFVWFILMPTCLIMRRQPEDFGLLPDGIKKDQLNQKQEPSLTLIELDHMNSFTRSEAIGTRALWLLILATGCSGAAIMTLLLHGIPFLLESGLTLERATLAFSIVGIGNLLCKLFWGWALGKFEAKKLHAMTFILLLGGLLLILYAVTKKELMLLMVGFFIFGTGFGGQIPISEYLWASYFGRANIGSIKGFGLPFSVAFLAGVPMIASLLYDLTGTYSKSWAVVIILLTLGGISILCIGKPNKVG